VLRALHGVLAGFLAAACTLPVGDKHGCRTSADCVGDRICVEQVCVGQACDRLCERECAALSECDVATLGCDEACAGERPPILGELPVTDDECRARWELAEQEPDCEAVLCAAHCDQLCAAALVCGSVDDVDACRTGCVAPPPPVCSPQQIAGLSCEQLVAAAICAEARGIHGPEYDCDHLPCEDDLDCAPAQTCVSSQCWTRCFEDYECGGGECSVDICTEPLGTPCNGEYGSCGPYGDCINVDADNRTSDYYCTRSCYDPTECPDGYSCVEYKCRQCSVPEACRYCGEYEDCSYLDDGTCDEPEGTGYCPDGSDPCDC
jgi:hypothetical protein